MSRYVSISETPQYRQHTLHLHGVATDVPPPFHARYRMPHACYAPTYGLFRQTGLCGPRGSDWYTAKPTEIYICLANRGRLLEEKGSTNIENVVVELNIVQKLYYENTMLKCFNLTAVGKFQIVS